MSQLRRLVVHLGLDHVWKNDQEKTEMATVERVENRVQKCARKQQNSELAGMDLADRHLESDV
mgnify:CR=1 FL=1